MQQSSPQDNENAACHTSSWPQTHLMSIKWVMSVLLCGRTDAWTKWPLLLLGSIDFAVAFAPTKHSMWREHADLQHDTHLNIYPDLPAAANCPCVPVVGVCIPIAVHDCCEPSKADSRQVSGPANSDRARTRPRPAIHTTSMRHKEFIRGVQSVCFASSVQCKLSAQACSHLRPRLRMIAQDSKSKTTAAITFYEYKRGALSG